MTESSYVSDITRTCLSILCTCAALVYIGRCCPRDCIESLLEAARAGHPALEKCSGACPRAEFWVSLCSDYVHGRGTVTWGLLQKNLSVGALRVFHCTFCYSNSHVLNAMYLACVCI